MPEESVNNEETRRAGRGRRRWRRRSVVVAGVSAILGWAAWDGSRDPKVGPRHAAEARALAREVATLESQYQRLREEGRGGPEAIELLDRARTRQRRRLVVEPTAPVEEAVRLERLEAARATEHARLATARVTELERAAAAEREAGRPMLALERLRAALALQREVDDSRADPREKNLVRERRLAHEVATAEAEPLAEVVEAARRAAREALADERWVAARAALAQAQAGQERLNREYAATRFARRPVLDELAGELATLEGAEQAEAIEAQVKAAEVAARTGRTEEAAESYGVAAARQRALNAALPRSRFASTTRIETLEARRQEVLAGALLVRAAAAAREARAALQRRQVFTAERKIAVAAALVDSVERDYPRAPDTEATLRLELAFLNRRRPQLRALQDAVYDRLAPVAADERRLMLTTKVPRELYAKVMGFNPGPRGATAEPVDAASWEEAQEFCRRLSWVLGAPVRLPSEDELRGALVEERSAENVAGFRELAKGRAEWLSGRGADGEEAAGAAVMAVTEGTLVGEVAERVRVTRMARHERPRDVSFRIVVELPEG